MKCNFRKIFVTTPDAHHTIQFRSHQFFRSFDSNAWKLDLLYFNTSRKFEACCSLHKHTIRIGVIVCVQTAPVFQYT